SHDPSPSVTYTLSLHDALPIFLSSAAQVCRAASEKNFFFHGNIEHVSILANSKSGSVKISECVVNFTFNTFDLGVFLIHHFFDRSEEHTSELQSRENLVCRLLL